MPKATSSWVSSTFDSVPKGKVVPATTSHEIRKRKGSSSIQVLSGDTPWVDKHAPSNKEDLAVHKRKVEQVEDWIRGSLNSSTVKRRKCPLLLLTGPTGSGKTATVKVLVASFNLALQEWKNTTQYVGYKSRSSNSDVPFEEQQIPSFSSFLLRASRYSSLFNDCESGRLVLVEDFPNVCYREPECLHSLLRQYVLVGRSPTVFILSDSSRREMSSYKLFPKDLIQELGIQEISFNPITSLTIGKIFQKILSAEKVVLGSQIQFLSKTELDSLAEASGGDIRTAVNSLQFASTCRSLPSSRKATKKSKQSSAFKKPFEPEKPSNVLGKDTSLVLFHALGKVLYCKRDPSKTEPCLPKHLMKFQRVPLIEIPEMVVDRAVLSSDSFNLFLHQNYMEFIENIELVCEASANLSTADCLCPKFGDQKTESEYCSSVGVRGLMFHLGNANANSSKRKWMPLRKPAWYDINRIYQKNLISSREEFKGQEHLMQVVTRFQRGNEHRYRPSEVLEEEDMDVSQAATYSFSKCKESVLEEDYNEDCVEIEEFCD